MLDLLAIATVLVSADLSALCEAPSSKCCDLSCLASSASVEPVATEPKRESPAKTFVYESGGPAPNEWYWEGRTHRTLLEHMVEDSNHSPLRLRRSDLQTLSYDELQQLHSWHHELEKYGRTNRPIPAKARSFVMKSKANAGQQTPQVQTVQPVNWSMQFQQTNCPGGVCPTPSMNYYSTRRFGWRR